MVCLLCNELGKSTQGKKGKKKPSDSSYRDLLSQLGASLKTHINELISTLEAWSQFSITNDLEVMLESLNLNQNDGQAVSENIVNSYVFAVREIQCVLKNKIKMLYPVL